MTALDWAKALAGWLLVRSCCWCYGITGGQLELTTSLTGPFTGDSRLAFGGSDDRENGMDFRAQYLQAMRYQAPALFKRLSKNGQLESAAHKASEEASRRVRELTQSAPKGKDGQPTLQAMREAEEYARAELLSVPVKETSLEQDERDYLLVGDRPLLPTESTF